MAKGEKNVLVLQGGGALGAYQAGAYEELARRGYEPDWVAGISIGAVNAAIICGNPPQTRVERLRTFWEKVSSTLVGSNPFEGELSRRAFNETSAGSAMLFGLPGFYSPRLPPAYLHAPGSPAALSYYDTSPLKLTLEELVDFGGMGKVGPRLSVGAVSITSGNFAYFDTADRKLTSEHIMASGALPPGFPPIEIEGNAYWDGGLVSNTPLQYILEEGGPREDMCIFQVDLFSARGPYPQTLLDVAQREKDIRFSSRTRLNTDRFRELQTLRRAAKRIFDQLPEKLKDSPDARILQENGCDAAVTIVHLIHRRAAYDSQSKDYEFSRLSVEEHWQAGGEDVRKTLRHKDWKERKKPKYGVQIFDLANR